MKTFIRTIVVLVVLNLATACSALAQNVSEREEMEAAKEDMKKAGQKMKESGQKMKAAMQYEMAEAAEAVRPSYDLPPVQLLQVRKRSTGRSPSLIIGPSAERYGGSGPVFVIPAGEINAQDLVTIMEDMRVMSRIFDKKLDLSPGGIFRGGGFDFSFFGLPGARSTEAIFLQGYGVLFLMRVDFPLSPPAEEEEEAEEKPKEHIDELWKETRQEIYEPEDARRRTDKEEEEEYDEEKVEEMKETLIKALKHTTNIRNLKADESVILTVAGESGQAGGRISSRVSLGTGQILVEDKDSKVVRIHEGPFSEKMGFTPTVMTIRVKKSDVDAFAKGKLDFDKFRQKVQIFTY